MTTRLKRTEVWFPPEREVRTGHRVVWPPDQPRRPIETRRFPVWWWPFEIAARWQARLTRYLPPELRQGTEEMPLL